MLKRIEKKKLCVHARMRDYHNYFIKLIKYCNINFIYYI